MDFKYVIFFLHFFQVAEAIEDLIVEHQRIPGSLMRALVERIYEIPKDKSH